jgi:hypothetical protein
VYDVHDIAADPRYGEFIKQNAVKRVRFNYSYELGQAVPNSFAHVQAPPPIYTGNWNPTNHDGRLTLKSVSMFGPGSGKLLPDFTFEYGHNPAYGLDKWDGFGMYAAHGTRFSNSHRPALNAADANADGAAWSLTRITNPLGGTTQIAYERDEYSSISGITDQVQLNLSAPSGSSELTVDRSGGFAGDLRDFFRVGERINVTGEFLNVGQCRRDGTSSTYSVQYPSLASKMLPILQVNQHNIIIGQISSISSGINFSNHSFTCDDLVSFTSILQRYSVTKIVDCDRRRLRGTLRLYPRRHHRYCRQQYGRTGAGAAFRERGGIDDARFL